MRKKYTEIVVGFNIPCDDVKRLELNNNLRAINRKSCDDNVDMSDDDDTIHKKVSVETSGGEHYHESWYYIVQVLEIVLVFTSLFLSAKNRHNIRPLINYLPKIYTSNKTFIRTLFKKTQVPDFNFTFSHHDEEVSYPLSFITSTSIDRDETPVVVEMIVKHPIKPTVGPALVHYLNGSSVRFVYIIYYHCFLFLCILSD